MDYYNTLGVAKNATPDEIKKAYRKLASQHHPDKGGDTNKFQDIQTAYDTLSDPNKKQAYDNPVQNNFPGGFTFNFSDNLHEIFGFNNINDLIRKQGRHGTQLLRTRIDITLTEAYFGITKSLKIQTQGQPSIPVNLNIPKGIQNGQQIRFEGLIPNAVLIVEFSVLSDLKFDRKGNDLYCNQSVNMLELITGTKFTFTTISGKVLEIPIKPLTQPYMNLKLSGQGMPLFNNPTYGDQIILIKPFIPDNINTEIIDVINKYKN